MIPPVSLFLLVLLLAWAVSLPLMPAAVTSLLPWAIYLQGLWLSGALAIACFSAAMLLALRWPVLSRPLGGLDRAYRIHRRLALWGTGLAWLHYGLRLAVKSARRAGLIVKPEGFPSQALDLFDTWHHSAKEWAEWALFIALGLVLLALWRRVPYRLFARLHRLMPLVYLAWVYHALVFMPAAWWRAPMGVLLALLMLAGAAAALLSLAGLIGRRRRVAATVNGLRDRGDGVLELSLDVPAGWPGHRSGQFALLCLDAREGAHPFTIASAWAPRPDGGGELRFGIKALGDFTRGLARRIAAGDAAWVEGPYGLFVFDDRRPRQIWIGAGIGMTPFLARMRALAQQGGTRQPVSLYYCTATLEPNWLEDFLSLAHAAGVELHVVRSAWGQRLDAGQLMREQPDWRHAGIWFCGPARFGESLKAELVHAGLDPQDFHQEAFEFR